MQISKDQFNELGNFYMNSLPFNDKDTDLMYKLFINLPDYLQDLAINYDLNDSVFRDDVFEFLCKNQFNMSCDEYCKSEIFENRFENKIFCEINFEKLKNN